MTVRFLTAQDLPTCLPIFPLGGVLLLPGGELPLNIFEDRYMAMVSATLQTPHRLIGIVQHKVPDATAAGDLCGVGCAGRITQFTETMDGRYQIHLTGICRFRILGEEPQADGYRRAQVDFSPFLSDMEANGALPPKGYLDRERFMRLLKSYFDAQGLSCNWTDIAKARDDHLMTALSMICPFSGADKQALLEATTLEARADVFFYLLERALLEGAPISDDQRGHHGHPTRH